MNDAPLADAVRARMQLIRRDIDQDVEDMVVSARNMVDWKHYVRTYPWVCLGTAAVLGFLVVPKRSTGVRVLAGLAALAKDNSHPVVKPAPAAARGLVDAIAATIANIAIRAATAYAGRSAARLLGIATSRSTPPVASGASDRANRCV